MQLNPVKIGQITCLIAALFTVSGCDQSEQLPVGSTATLFPAEVDWDIGRRNENCAIVDDWYNDQHVIVSLKDGEGRPLIEAPLTISLDLSESTFSGTPVLKLYDDLNDDGLYQDNELVSNDLQAAYNTETDSLTGVKHLMVRVNLSCPYRGSLYAFSGNAGELLNITVTAEIIEADESSNSDDESDTDTDTDETQA